MILSAPFMDGKTLVTRIAALIVGLSLANLLFTAAFLNGRGMGGNTMGLVINLVLAYFLIAGHGWARWITAARSGFSAIFTVTAFVSLPTFGGSYLSIGGLWLLLVIAVSLFVAGYLLASKRVNEHFSPSTGF